MNEKEFKNVFKKCGFVQTITSSTILDELLFDNENIDFIQRCKIDNKKWIMICTNKRLLLVTDKLMNRDFKEIKYSKISSVESEKHTKIFGGGLIIEYSGGKIECGMTGIFASGMRDAITNRINNNEQNEISSESNKMDNLDTLKKLKELLDIGAITKEEFELKKKQLLDL